MATSVNLNANAVFAGPACVPVILISNPRISNSALAGVVEANLIDFKGNVSVATKTHRFATGNKKARAIYITPYGNVTNFLVSLKRTFAGVTFDALSHPEGNITAYVIGVLPQGSPDYQIAKQNFDEAVLQGRRILVTIAIDCSNMVIELEQSRGCVIC